MEIAEFQERIKELLDEDDELELTFIKRSLRCTLWNDNHCQLRYVPVDNLDWPDALAFIISYIREIKNGPTLSKSNQDEVAPSS